MTARRKTTAFPAPAAPWRIAPARLVHTAAIAILVVLSFLVSACVGGSGETSRRNPSLPLIEPKGDRVVDQAQGEKYVDAGATAKDVTGDEITDWIVVSGLKELDVDTSGDYFIRYAVTNAHGKKALEVVRIVRVRATNFVLESARPLGTTGAGMGYYEHLPTNYGEGKPPLLIWNHGYGRSRDFGSTGSELEIMRGLDIFQGIESGTWSSSLPFVVLMPQRDPRDTSQAANYTALKELIDYAVRTYDIDSSRIYMAGFSDGAYVTWQYVSLYPRQLAAAVPIAGYSPYIDGCALKSTPVWAFQTKDDELVPWQATLATVKAVNDCHPSERARFTLFPSGGHTPLLALDSHNVGEGDPAYDVYEPNVSDWLLAHHR